MDKKKKSVFLSIKEKYCLDDSAWNRVEGAFNIVKAQEAILKICDMISQGGGKLRHIKFLIKLMDRHQDKDLSSFLVKHLDPELKKNNIARCAILNIRLTDVNSVKQYTKERQKKYEALKAKAEKLGKEFGKEEERLLKKFDSNFPIETVNSSRASALPLEEGGNVYLSFDALVALKVFYSEVKASGDKAAKIRLGLMNPPSNIENYGSYNIVKKVVRTRGPLSEENLKKLSDLKKSLTTKK